MQDGRWEDDAERDRFIRYMNAVAPRRRPSYIGRQMGALTGAHDGGTGPMERRSGGEMGSAVGGAGSGGAYLRAIRDALGRANARARGIPGVTGGGYNPSGWSDA